jgi:hypothetical protein
MSEIKPIYVIGGVGAVVVVLLLLRRSGSSSPVIVTAPAAAQSNPDTARLSELALNADLFKNLAGLIYTQRGADSASRVGMAQIEASRQVGLAQTQAASNVAAAQVTAASNQASLAAQLQAQAINAAQAVGLAQAQADISRQQMQYAAQANQQAAQNRNSLLQGLLSQVGNVLRAIGQQPQQQQPKPATGGSSGGASGGGGSSASPATTTRPRTRLNPALPPSGIDLFGGLGGIFPNLFPDYGFGPDYGVVPDPGFDWTNIDAAAPPIPVYSGPGGYVDVSGDVTGIGWEVNPFDPWGEGFGYYSPDAGSGSSLPGTGGLDEIIGWLGGGGSGSESQPPPSGEAFDPWGEGFGYYEP